MYVIKVGTGIKPVQLYTLGRYLAYLVRYLKYLPGVMTADHGQGRGFRDEKISQAARPKALCGHCTPLTCQTITLRCPTPLHPPHIHHSSPIERDMDFGISGQLLAVWTVTQNFPTLMGLHLLDASARSLCVGKLPQTLYLIYCGLFIQRILAPECIKYLAVVFPISCCRHKWVPILTCFYSSSDGY